jgi:hypothetical protein
MKNLIVLFCLMLLAACSSGKPMTATLYSDVSIGMSVEDLKQVCGDPMEIKHHSNEDEYIYVERLTMGQCRVAENYYSFFIQEDKVVRKSIRTQKPPAFNLIYTEDPNNPCS